MHSSTSVCLLLCQRKGKATGLQVVLPIQKWYSRGTGEGADKHQLFNTNVDNEPQKDDRATWEYCRSSCAVHSAHEAKVTDRGSRQSRIQDHNWSTLGWWFQ
uniref:Uncharacterized protein n=1 Tax=Eutreptiella gymnastica TaxID=73025 RepID=A0A7S4LKH1_9EUGL